MMNREDQLGAREDIVKMELAHTAVDADADTAIARDEEAQIRGLGLTIRRQDSTIKELRAQLGAMTERNNEAVLVANATGDVLAKAVKVIADATRRPVAEVERQTNEIRSIRYDQVVSEALKLGQLTADPRNTDRIKNRKWYTPNLER